MIENKKLKYLEICFSVKSDLATIITQPHNMKKLLFKSLIISNFLMLLIFNVFATEEKSLLWKISGNGLEQESYLFGTIHLICQDQFKMDARILQAFESSEKIIMEIDISDPNVMMDMQRLSLNKDFKNIKDEFDPDHQVAVDEFLKAQFGVGLDQLGVMKPFILSTMIMTKMLPCEEISGYEMFFIEKAKELGKGLGGLETAEFQIGLFDQIPIKTQLDDIGKMVIEGNSMEEFQTLVDAYLNEDIDLLFELITVNEMFQQYGDILLNFRNETWIPQIEEAIKEQATFIAVGSGHLSSELGVIQLLRNAGYTVEPVR